MNGAIDVQPNTKIETVLEVEDIHVHFNIPRVVGRLSGTFWHRKERPLPCRRIRLREDGNFWLS